MYPYSAEEETEFVNKRRKITISEMVKDAQKCISKNFPGVVIENQYNNRQAIVFVPKKDDITRTCPIAMRQHKSNSIYFSLNLFTAEVVCRCFKPSCVESVKLDSDGQLAKDLVGKVEVSVSKYKKKGNNFTALPSVKNVKVSNFNHQTISLSVNEIFDLYSTFNFVYCPAKKDQKRPVFSGWTKNTLADNQIIDIDKNNVAIVTGKSSAIFVLDVDVKDGGLDWFQRFCSQNSFNYTNYTLSVLTPSGGVHLYFLYSECVSGNKVRMKDENGADIGLDIRSNEGCVIAPPSKYSTGTYYFMCLKPPQACPAFILSLFTS